MRLLECMSCTARGSRQQHGVVKSKSINKTREFERAIASSKQEAAAGKQHAAREGVLTRRADADAESSVDARRV